jgi:acetyl esterase/lipase
MSSNNKKSHHLVAPELVWALDLLPDLDFSQGMASFRTAFADRQRPPMLPELAAVSCEERHVPGVDGARPVRVLLYTPPGTADELRPGLLHIHGGGFVLGDPEINDLSNRAKALELGCVVVSVDYRLAPETPFPGALDDCHAALVWMRDAATDLNLDPARIAVAGESAGGGHAVALALHVRDRGGPAIAFLLLDAPMLDDRTGSSHDPHPYCGEFGWTAEKNRFGWASLLGMEPGGSDVPAVAVPARASDLSGLPPTFISVGALDLFLEEDMEFARRLTRAGVPVELHVIPGAYHGFGVAASAPQVAEVGALRTRALARALGC